MAQVRHTSTSTDDGAAFAVLGLTGAEEDAYRELTRMRTARPGVLRERLGLSTAEARHVFAALESKGLVSWTTGTPRRLVAAPPRSAVDVLALQVERELQGARVAAAQLAVEWSTAQRHREADELVEVLTGEDAILRRFQSMIGSARKEILGFAAAPIMAPDEINRDVNIEALNRGVRLRTIYERAVLDMPDFAEVIAACEASGEQIRIIDRLPSKMVLVDDEAALLPVYVEQSQPATSAALIHAPLAHTFTALFEELWRRAMPATMGSGTPTGDSAPSADDRKLLSLVLGGLPDDAVARHLEISRRTVNRRIQRLIELAGVETRMQLLWRASECGWLSTPPPRPRPAR